MKTYQEISKEEVDKFIQQGYSDKPIGFDEHVSKLYAQQVGEDVKQRCYDNAKIKENWYGGDLVAWVDRKSILNTEIILP